MGRSGGRAKLGTRKTVSRGKISVETISDTSSESRAGLNTKTDYIPQSDHDQLLSDAIQLWSANSNYLFDSDLAAESWESYITKKEGVSRNDPAYWDRAREALLFQMEKEEISGPLFRGQAAADDHPLDRVRSWSKDLNVAVKFLLSHDLLLENEKGEEPIDFNKAKELAQKRINGQLENKVIEDGGSLKAVIYVADDPRRGLDFGSESLKAQRKKEALENFQSGNVDNSYYRFNQEMNRWDRMDEGVELYHLKQQAVKDILSDPERVTKIADHFNLDPKDDSKRSRPALHSRLADYSSFSEIEDLLESVGENKKALEFGQRVGEIKKAIEAEPDIYVADYCHLDEQEVILPIDEAAKSRRVEVILAESDEELSRLSFQDIKGKIKAAISQ